MEPARLPSEEIEIDAPSFIKSNSLHQEKFLLELVSPPRAQ